MVCLRRGLGPRPFLHGPFNQGRFSTKDEAKGLYGYKWGHRIQVLKCGIIIIGRDPMHLAHY